MRNLFLALAILAAALVPAAANGATLIVGGNTLTGATGVNVNGTLYDVTFLDGTCASVFAGCDDNSDFAINNLTDATAAAQALLDQVFIDGLAGPFDTNPFQTNGCADITLCTAWIPYSVSGFTVSQMQVDNSNGADFIFTGVNIPDGDTTPLSTVTWARFTLSVASVPEPASWAMMLLGFAGIGMARQRKAVGALRHA